MDDRMDRDAVERVLRRAHAIEERASPSTPDGIEPEALVAAASEVGIDPNAVRDSLALERFVGPAPVERRFDRLVGPERVVVEREMHVTVDDALAGVEAWLATVHRLACDRRSSSTLFAHRRTDAIARVSRSVSATRGENGLAVRSLVAEAVPRIVGSSPDRPRCVVRISVDRGPTRAFRLGGGASLGAGGVGLGGAAAAAAETLVAWPLVALPLAVGGYGVARSGRGHADRVELQLERMLSRVDRGERPTGLLSRVARQARDLVGTPRRRR